MIITNSEVQCFRDCKARHGYRYVRLLREKAERGGARTVGRLAHYCLRGAFQFLKTNGDAGVQEVVNQSYLVHLDALRLPEYSEMDPDSANSAAWCAENIIRNRVPRMIEVGGRVLAAELTFSVPIENELGTDTGDEFAGQIDLIWYSPKGDILWVEDHKTTDRIEGVERKIKRDPQLTAYSYAVQKLLSSGDGLRSAITGETRIMCAYNVSRSTIPRVPETLKSGTVSTALCVTTPEIYRAALDRQEAMGKPITPEQLNRLEYIANTQRFFERHEFDRSYDVERWLDEVRIEVKRMKLCEKKPWLRTTNPGHCSSPMSSACEYDPICGTTDNEQIIPTIFRIATKKHEELNNDETK